MFRGLGRAAKPAKAAAKREALRRLPKRGGLAELVASSRIGSRNRLAGNDPSVRIVATNPDNIRRIDKGTVRHPVFGNPDVFVTQKVPRGWWTDPMRLNAPRTRRELAAALEEVAKKLAKRL